MNAEDRLELFFSQSLDGFFFMMLDEPVRWDDSVDKEQVLDYVFTHQRVTKVNDALLAQYGATREAFLGTTPTDLFRHDLAHGRRVWRDFFDRGRLHVETDERRVDGTPIRVEGDYICFYDEQGRITGHFGIQRDVSERERASQALRQSNRRLEVLHDIHRDILGSRSPQTIAEATLRHLQDLIPCRRASVAVFDLLRGMGTVIASYDEGRTQIVDSTPVPIEEFGVREELQAGLVGSLRSIRKGLPSDSMSFKLPSTIHVPLLADSALIGVLSVIAPEGSYLDFGAIAIGQEVASSLAVAIRQAQLREHIERHNVELEDRVRARTADLERSENRLSAIVNALPDLVLVVNDEGRYVEILTAKEDLLYRARAEMKGRTFHDILPPAIAGSHLRLVQRTLDTHTSQTLEYSLSVPAGERWFEARTGLLGVQIDGRPAVVFIARDVTDRKRAEDLESQNIYLQEEIKVERSYGDVVGESAAIRRVFKAISMVADTESTVLVLGETGTGKELTARAIHNLSRRRNGVMVKVNCAALPSGLAESELFGHERGAFTGAVQQKKGRFELAHNGTIFLDEVGELSLDVQVKLLRVLQEQEFERLGSTRPTKVNVRVIAATNRDLEDEIARGRFRSDLFYRLNIFPIHLPPLRERKPDITLLAKHFAVGFARKMGKRVVGIDEQALARLTGYDWPGNVRELANVLERAVILCDGSSVLVEHLGELTRGRRESGVFPTLEEMERQHILRALAQTGGVLAGPEGAARLLGMRRSTVWSRMKKLGIRTSHD
ncbi:MAG TPA: sigma 54-interacting transcriptional regulator [Vicinamibacterales bacterium]|jgi:PAS domain S-box-containing protein|nr:sigma 54-interacting transcriptional regulator [Vicinamibacterales bacterium]